MAVEWRLIGDRRALPPHRGSQFPKVFNITWFTITSRSQSPRTLSTYITTSLRQTPFLYIYEMSVLSKETKITLAIEAIRTTKKMSIRRTIKTYDLLESSFRNRMKDMIPLAERYNGRYRLTPAEEETLLRYILDLDSRRFAPRIDNMEDIANILFTTYSTERVGARWIYCFIYQRPELKTRLSRSYDFQRALYEDPKFINTWFRLITNICTKYNIQDCDFYNFDETDFIINIICNNIMIIYVDRNDRSKKIQS